MPKPTPPPIAHRLRPAVDLYMSPVAVPANIVLIWSSSPRAYCNRTPKPEYITVNAPNVFAVAVPCFTTWFNSLCSMREIAERCFCNCLFVFTGCTSFASNTHCVRRNFPVCCARVVARKPLYKPTEPPRDAPICESYNRWFWHQFALRVSHCVHW